ncbi:hypothetical protein V8C34DRAFT_315369 [Trichoderma compactum]
MQSPELSDVRQEPLRQGTQRQPRIWILNTSPDDASKSSNAKIVRSHAAKEGHYRQRERRRGHLKVRQYQPVVPSNKHKRYTSEGEHGTQTQIRPQTTRNPEPQSSLSSRRIDPLQRSARTTSHVENVLIDHYKSLTTSAIENLCMVDNGYCVQMIRAALSSTEISDQTIALALVLAVEEVQCRSYGVGIIKVVNIRGGISNFGNGFLEHVL